MRTAVTGAAGFIGAALCRFLIQRGDEVLGIDSFLDSYPREIKEDRLADLLAQERFRFVEADLIVGELTELIADIDCVFHLAAQAGVRTSWGGRFAAYADNNILATQRLLEAAEATGVGRLVYASSSAVYGDAAIPTPEDAPLNPLSPYAVSKLAGEQLCALYGVPTVVLRFFTVYGPKPRPDQAVCIFTRALLEGRAIRILGDGEQLRGMSYVDDVAAAILVAAERDCEGEILNVGGPRWHNGEPTGRTAGGNNGRARQARIRRPGQGGCAAYAGRYRQGRTAARMASSNLGRRGSGAHGRLDPRVLSLRRRGLGGWRSGRDYRWNGIVGNGLIE